MDLKFIQSELEKLTAMVASWNNDEAVAAIERDIALDKIKNIYNAMRFEAQPIATPIIPAPVTEPEIEPSNNTDEQQEEPEVKDVEVEKNGEKMGRKVLYTVMIKFLAPVFMIILLLKAFGLM